METYVKTVCPKCNKAGLHVIESRYLKSTGFRRRRKECVHCKERFTTFEVSEEFYTIGKAVVKAITPHFIHAKPSKCLGCIHNSAKRNVCSLELPEYMTAQSNECLYFNHA